MLQIYYKIWVSIYMRIQKAQNSGKSYTTFLALLVISSMNFLNYFAIQLILLLNFKLNFNIFKLIKIQNNILEAVFVFALFFTPNFLLFINKRNENLIQRYEQEHKNIGIKYVFISVLIVFLVFLSMYIFSDFYGLKPSSKD